MTGCECNNKADRCYFDEDLYQTTGRGGHCIDCRDNTDGPHCERCKDNHYLKPDDRRCTPCECNPTGKTDPKSQSVTTQVRLILECNPTGKINPKDKLSPLCPPYLIAYAHFLWFGKQDKTLVVLSISIYF